MKAELTIGKIGAFKSETLDVGEDRMEVFNAVTLFAINLEKKGWECQRDFDDLLTARKNDLFLFLHLK